MSLFDNTYPYTANIKFNPDCINEVYNNVKKVLMIESNGLLVTVIYNDYTVLYLIKLLKCDFVILIDHLLEK